MTCTQRLLELRAAGETASRTTNHRRQPSPPGSIRHDRDHRIATTPRRSRLLLVLNRLPSRSLNCAVRPSTQSATLSGRPNHQSQLLLPACRVIARAAAHRAHLRRQPNPHSQGRGASAHHRPRVRSLAAFGRRPTCTWLRRSSPASETLHTTGQNRALLLSVRYNPFLLGLRAQEMFGVLN